MAHKCPRCGGSVQRGCSSTAQATAGMAGALFYSAFGAFGCKNCGKIALDEFPAEERGKIAAVTFLLVMGTLAIAVGVLWIFSTM